MKNATVMTALILAIAAGGAVASSDKMGGKHQRPHHSFEELDANSDGKLTPEEIEAHMQARFEGADSDGDGKLSKDELLARLEERRAERAQRYVDHMLERHDADGDGTLSLEELQERRDGRMFARMDADDDGAVSKEEFEAMRDKHARHKKGKHGKAGDKPAAE